MWCGSATLPTCEYMEPILKKIVSLLVHAYSVGSVYSYENWERQVETMRDGIHSLFQPLPLLSFPCNCCQLAEKSAAEFKCSKINKLTLFVNLQYSKPKCCIKSSMCKNWQNCILKEVPNVSFMKQIFLLKSIIQPLKRGVCMTGINWQYFFSSVNLWNSYIFSGSWPLTLLYLSRGNSDPCWFKNRKIWSSLLGKIWNLA